MAQVVRIIYGGSVALAYAEGLLASPQVDGLGAGRHGRDPSSFAQIVQLIATTKGLMEVWRQQRASDSSQRLDKTVGFE